PSPIHPDEPHVTICVAPRLGLIGDAARGCRQDRVGRCRQDRVRDFRRLRLGCGQSVSRGGDRRAADCSRTVSSCLIRRRRRSGGVHGNGGWDAFLFHLAAARRAGRAVCQPAPDAV
ncbi:unnamed protein product, partial [Ectocarpus sp. 12 AP-2014]